MLSCFTNLFEKKSLKKTFLKQYHERLFCVAHDVRIIMKSTLLIWGRRNCMTKMTTRSKMKHDPNRRKYNNKYRSNIKRKQHITQFVRYAFCDYVFFFNTWRVRRPHRCLTQHSVRKMTSGLQCALVYHIPFSLIYNMLYLPSPSCYIISFYTWSKGYPLLFLISRFTDHQCTQAPSKPHDEFVIYTGTFPQNTVCHVASSLITRRFHAC